VRVKSASSCGLAADASLLAPEGWSGKNPIALDLDIHDAPAALTEGWLPNPGRSASSHQGQIQ